MSQPFVAAAHGTPTVFLHVFHVALLKAMNELLQGNPYAIKDGAAGAPGAAEMNAAWPSAATALQPTGYYTGYDHPSLAAYG